MNVLVACERSGRVRDAFIAQGHSALSCDLEPTDVDGPHHQGDVLPLLRKRWDLVVAFPPCTDLAGSGARWWKDKDRRPAMRFFMDCYDANAPRVAVENPVGCMSTVFRKPDQIVHPWMWGDDYTKSTCLWLRGLPPLIPSIHSSPNADGKYIHHLGSRKRGRIGSITPPGLAQAMAVQW